MAGKYNVAVEFTPYEQKILVGQLNERRTALKQEGKPTEDVDDIILKTINAKQVKKKWWRDER